MLPGYQGRGSTCVRQAPGPTQVNTLRATDRRHLTGFRQAARQGRLGSNQQQRVRASTPAAPAHALSASNSSHDQKGRGSRPRKRKAVEPLSPAEEQAVRQFWQSRGVINKQHLQKCVTFAQRWPRHRDIAYLSGYMARWDLVRQEFPDLDVDRVVRSNYLFIQSQRDAANCAGTLRELYAGTSADVDWQKAANNHGGILTQTAETTLQKLALLQDVFSKHYPASHRTGVSMQRIVQQAPRLLTMASASLPGRLDALLATFQPAVVAAIVTRAPMLLSHSATILAAKRDALQQLLPGADIDILIRVSPGVLALDPETVAANVAALDCLNLGSSAEVVRLLEYQPTLLGKTATSLKWTRLRSLTAQYPEWQGEPEEWRRMDPTPSKLANALQQPDHVIDQLMYLVENSMGREKSAYTWLRQPPALFSRLHPDFAAWQAARAAQHAAKQAGQ